MPVARGALRPLGVDQVRLDPAGLLGHLRARNATATLWHCADHLESHGNLDNLRAAAGEPDTEFAGMWFADSDVYKTLEAAAWELASAPDDAELRTLVKDVVALLARAQRPDGYLNSYFTVVEPEARWRKPDWSHELYCAGHLFQAAVAAGRTGAAPELVDIARRFADLLATRFGQVEEIDGHPEVETALVELYRLTGHRPYLELARRLLDLRGRGLLGQGRFGSAYYQDHVPPRAAREVAGHSVRQLYLLAGMVDVAVETDDAELFAAAERLWDDAFGTRVYITGAHGSRHRDEAYGDPYELPADRAYAETCASIASFQWNWRMLLATGGVRYADEMERVLCNAIAAAVSADGRHFFYSDPLHLRANHHSGGEEDAARRSSWFRCACCPPNIARLMASLPAYVATADDSGLQIHLYGQAQVTATVAGAPVRVEMTTVYPWDGRVELTIIDGPATPWTLALRIPGWCEAYTLTGTTTGTVNGGPAEAADGYVRLTGAWAPGARIVLDLAMPVRRMTAHPRVDAVRGCVALARGPLVYCLEQADLEPGALLDDVRLDPAATIEAGAHADLPDIPVVLTLSGSLADGGPSLYRTQATERPATPITLTAIPYFLWGNRTEGPMRVWIPVAPEPRTT
ncbi:glycoside hydrolase family 127 protein [Streptosporangiaceae bacterium NEAU-GS5]|nr:glycoside hydrolase family 127 protein [Streptosporangiaceae bacterium NEAU-GS5]